MRQQRRRRQETIASYDTAPGCTRVLARVVLLMVLIASVAVHATFAASTGFSGRNADCTTCHSPVGTATAHLGAPEMWVPGETYTLDVRVTGGPAAAPDPQPKGGFELEAQAGVLDEAAGYEDLLRVPKPTIITYEPAGTLQRAWSVDWTAPGLDEPPVPLTFWLAVVSANGNHIIATNTSDGGETGDAVATTTLTIPPSAAAVAAWEAIPLARPIITGITATPEGHAVTGYHSDDNATHLAYSFGDGWTQQATEREWRLVVRGDLDGLQLRSEGTGRTSDIVRPEAGTETTPLPVLVPVLGLLLARRMR